MDNHGNYIISPWQSVPLARRSQAEALGVELYPGFARRRVFYDEDGRQWPASPPAPRVSARMDSRPRRSRPASICARAKITLVAEGRRGRSPSARSPRRFELRRDSGPQTYGIGLKELWEVDAARHRPGLVVHTVGWPLDRKTYGGSFLYHLARTGKVAVGFVVGLDYTNPCLNPFEEFQRFKTHLRRSPRPSRRRQARVAYGARALNEGGFQAIPKLAFPGGLVIGCAAGFLNVAKIKGSHTAMKSGMVAAEIAHRRLARRRRGATTAPQYSSNAGCGPSCMRCGNIRPGFRWGLWAGLAAMPRSTHICCAARRPGPCGTMPTTPRSPAPTPAAQDRLSEARWRADIRPPLVGLCLEYAPRGEPAVGNLHLRRIRKRRFPSITRFTTRPSSAIVLPEYTRFCGTRRALRGFRSTRRIACIARHATSRTPPRISIGSVPEGGGGPNYPNM